MGESSRQIESQFTIELKCILRLSQVAMDLAFRISHRIARFVSLLNRQIPQVNRGTNETSFILLEVYRFSLGIGCHAVATG
jgi:hypothetical protein